MSASYNAEQIRSTTFIDRTLSGTQSHQTMKQTKLVNLDSLGLPSREIERTMRVYMGGGCLGVWNSFLSGERRWNNQGNVNSEASVESIKASQND